MVEQTKKRPESQIENFWQAARELEADDSEQRFNERLGKIVPAEASVAGEKVQEGDASLSDLFGWRWRRSAGR